MGISEWGTCTAHYSQADWLAAQPPPTSCIHLLRLVRIGQSRYLLAAMLLPATASAPLTTGGPQPPLGGPPGTELSSRVANYAHGCENGC